MKQLICLLWVSVAAVILAACTPAAENSPAAPLPTIATAAEINVTAQPDSNVVPLPPTNTPISAQVEAGFAEALPVDETLLEIDQSVCAKLADAQAELEALRGQGQDVSELETAVEELKLELENC